MSYLFSRFLCEKQGRFADPSDCTSYFECLPDLEKGGLKAYPKVCLIGGFDANKKACVEFSKVNDDRL